MQSNQAQLDKLDLERVSLASATKLHWFHWLIVILSLLLTTGAWQFAHSQVKAQQKARFDREASQVLDLIAERMTQYEDALWSGVAAIHSMGDNITHKEWRTFSQSLNVTQRYPGINGIGVIKQVKPSFADEFVAEQRKTRPNFSIHPKHNQSVLMPITYIEPETQNWKAVGLDVAHEKNRFEAALKARSTGNAQITGPIVLVQDAGKTPGFLFFTPYYAVGSYSSEKERLDNFKGMVYAPFIVKTLMEGALDKNRRHVGISITDVENVMYDEHNVAEQDFDAAPLYRMKSELNSHGRTWTFDIRSTQSFRAATGSNQPIVILIGGIIIDTLLIGFFLMLCRTNRRAILFADRMTQELRQKANALAESNAELETFAYVTSHDLKTPLRGMGDLTEYLEEDLEDYLSDPAANPDVRHNINRLRTQVRRMDNLIKGILDYSSLTSDPDTVEIIVVPALIQSLKNELSLRDSQLVLHEDCPKAFPTHATRFQQVLSNLIGNAFKYHHDQEQAVINVQARSIGSYYRFSVIDNGPGIDPKFHARIFEVFQTLQSKDEIDSSGVGLSIVKKIVESYGGKVYVDSVLGEGTAFSFDWPKDIAVRLRTKQG